MSHTNTSCRTRIRHVAHEYVMSHTNTSCRTRIRHVTHEYVMSHTNTSCRTRIRHVAHEYVMSHTNTSCRTRIRHVPCAQSASIFGRYQKSPIWMRFLSFVCIVIHVEDRYGRYLFVIHMNHSYEWYYSFLCVLWFTRKTRTEDTYARNLPVYFSTYVWITAQIGMCDIIYMDDSYERRIHHVPCAQSASIFMKHHTHRNE